MGRKIGLFVQEGKIHEHVDEQASMDYLAKFESGFKKYVETGWGMPFFASMFVVSTNTGASPCDKIVSHGTVTKKAEFDRPDQSRLNELKARYGQETTD